MNGVWFCGAMLRKVSLSWFICCWFIFTEAFGLSMVILFTTRMMHPTTLEPWGGCPLGNQMTWCCGKGTLLSQECRTAHGSWLSWLKIQMQLPFLSWPSLSKSLTCAFFCMPSTKWQQEIPTRLPRSMNLWPLFGWIDSRTFMGDNLSTYCISAISKT